MRNNIAGPPARAIPGYLAGRWQADREHSAIAFSVRQLGVKVRGRFTGFDITIVTGDDLSASSVSATIDLSSIDTGNEKRDAHIRSGTFLDVAEYPSATYDSTVVRRGDAGWIVDGDLTLHGITRNVPLLVAGPEFRRGPDGGARATFSATTQLRRGEFGIDRWTGGGLVVSDRVSIRLEIQAVPR
jgi:polyisoprenoid-binding protein YceI